MKKILLIEDEPDLARITDIWLKEWGYEVAVAMSAEEGLEILEQALPLPDIILLDLLLPKMQGDRLCRMIKSDNRFKRIPVLIFTAYTVGIQEKAKDMGADDFETKPFDPEQLMVKIKKLLFKYREIRPSKQHKPRK